MMPIAQNPQEVYQIEVKTAGKGSLAKYTYTAADTIKSLNEKIKENEGIPDAQQRLQAHYGMTKCWEVRELDDEDALLVNCLRNVSYLTLHLKLRQA